MGYPAAPARYVQVPDGEARRLDRQQGQETAMSSIIGQAPRNTRKASWKIVLAVGALAAMVAGTVPAAALDQQATDPANDNIANWRAGGPLTGGAAYDRAAAPHRSGPYASARSDRPAAATAPKDFQPKEFQM